jgi:hypothetical protein
VVAPTFEEEGTIQVNAKVVYRAEDSAMRSVPTFELQFVPARPSSVLDFPRAEANRSEQEDGAPTDPRCMRGIQSALAIEALAALMFYGFWQLSHLLR